MRNCWIRGARYYLQRLEAEQKRLGSAVQLQYINQLAEEAATIATNGTQNLLDRPFYVTPGQMVLDAKGLNLTAAALNTAANTPTNFQTLNNVIGITSSSLENQLWEELVLVPSISTTKALQLASQAGMTLTTITQSNLTQLSSSQIPTSIQTAMTTDINKGATVLTALKPVTLNSWTGWAG